MFTLDHPWLLPALLLLPLLLRLVLPAYRERRVAIAVPNMGRLSALTGSEAGKGAVVLRSTLVQRVLLWITWIGLVVAAARPRRTRSHCFCCFSPPGPCPVSHGPVLCPKSA